MRLPQKKKPGDPVLASDWNLLIDAIAARTPRPGAGLELTASSGGFAYARPSTSSVPHTGLPPFAVIGIEKHEGDYLVTVKEGWVIERKPKSGESPVVRFHMPKVGGERLDRIPRPPVPMAIGDTLWCRFTTDSQGEITGEPEVLAAAEEPESQHHHPGDPDGSGGNGIYCVPLLKLEDDDGSLTVKAWQQSDIEHSGHLWTGRNAGDGARVFMAHAEDENVYRFRSLTHRETQHQIEVVEDGDVIRVQGNNHAGSLSLVGDALSSEPLLAWQDGLVTSDGEKQLTVREFMVCESGSPVAVKFVVVE